jgi:hypothetical protein
MSDQLPYELTEGVIATEEGLLISNVKRFYLAQLLQVTSEPGEICIPWPDAADRLHYRDGKPWCYEFHGSIICGKSGVPKTVHILHQLHRIAAILCEDAEAFRVLHACIEEFGYE